MLNVVCLVGRLAEPLDHELPFRSGWTSLTLRVPRRGPRGEKDAGVFNVHLMLPPSLASREARSQDIGACVSIVGMLVSDTDYSGRVPRIRHAVIPQSIERLPDADPATSD